jgi:oligopeptide transport system substrate-binding protein
VDRRTFLAALAAAPAALLSGCGPAGPGARTLRLAFRTDFKTMDPAISYDAETLPIMRLLYQGLLDADDDVKLVPWLAEEMPAVSADKLAYTFRVRRGIRFANGREMGAADFVYAIQRTLDPATKSPWPSFLKNVRGARDFEEARKRGDAEARVVGLSAPDRFTLRIELEKPDLAFLWVLTLPFTYAVPHEEVERHGDEFYRNPCGTGPMVLAEWRRGLRLRLGRNPHYDRPDPPGYDAFEVLIGYDEMTQAMMFERGDLDILPSLSRPDYVRFLRDPRLRPCVRSLQIQETEFLIMNTEMEPFTDKRVRQAVCFAVDRERVVKMLNNRGVPATGLTPPGVPGYDPSRRGYAHDPERARRLLAEAGRGGGFKVPLWYIADTDRWGRIAEVVKQDLAEVGIEAELKPAAFNVCIDAIARRREVPLSVLGWTEDYPDPSDFLNALCDGTRIVDNGCNNMAFYDDAGVNDLLGRAAVETDEERRVTLYRQAEDVVMDDAPYCVLLYNIESRAAQPRVKGFRLHPMWFISYEKLSLEGA